MDSSTALASYPMMFNVADGYYPWRGGIYDPVTYLVVAVSGGTELEDVFLAQIVMAFCDLVLNRAGEMAIAAARARAEAPDASPEDRFTQTDDGVNAVN
ncbi:hypothetical protein KDA23_05400 [Candidatus Saccharibacteria bacterium]|nr:hypothetical protein [Candidatus Saccharibacteria bacterium]MCB9821138.1 hypothetical protein [Candidatus Nomurabacteria bacterium]